MVLSTQQWKSRRAGCRRKNAPDATFREVAQIFIACFDRPSFAGGDDQDRAEIKGKTKRKAEALLNFLSTHPSATIPEMAAKLNLNGNTGRSQLINL